MIKLNLGAGFRNKEGFKSVDSRKETNPDYLINLEEENCLKNINDNSVDEVYASHILEHIKNLEGLMIEIYRVCKHKAKVIIAAPYWSHHTAVEDPTHVRYFAENSMIYYSRKTIGSDKRPITIPYDFRTKNVKLAPEKEYINLSIDELRKKAKKYLNVISQIEFELFVNKI